MLAMRRALSSSDVDLHYQAIHRLWELVCDTSNHPFVTYSIFERAAAMLRSSELRVQSIAAATVWKLAQEPSTIVRMPVADLVPALLLAVLKEPSSTPPGAKAAASRRAP